MLCIVSLNRLRRYRFGGGDCCSEQLSPNWPVQQQQPSAALASAVSWSLLCKHTRRRPRRRQRACRLLSLPLLALSPLFRLFCLRKKCSVAVFLFLFTPVAAAAVVEISAAVTTHSLLLLIATRWSLSSTVVVVVEVVVWWSQQLAFSLRCPALLCCRSVSAFLKLKPFCLRHCNELVSWIRHTILILTLADFFSVLLFLIDSQYRLLNSWLVRISSLNHSFVALSFFPSLLVASLIAHLSSLITEHYRWSTLLRIMKRGEGGRRQADSTDWDTFSHHHQQLQQQQ